MSGSAPKSNTAPIHPATFELIGKSRELADSLSVRCGVILAGYQVKPLAKELIAAGADDVYVIEHPLLAEFDPFSYRKAVADVVDKIQTADRPLRRNPGRARPGPDGLLPCRLRPDRRLHRTGYPRQFPQRTDRHPAANPPGSGRQRHGHHLHQGFQLPDGHRPSRRHAATGRRIPPAQAVSSNILSN